MQTWLATWPVLIHHAQLLLGTVALTGVLLYLLLPGRWRRAFTLPPAPPNDLNGSHLLFILFVLFGLMLMMQTAISGLNLVTGGASSTASAPILESVPTTQPASKAPASDPSDSNDHAATTQMAKPVVEVDTSEPFQLVGQGLGEILAIGVMIYVASITVVGGRRGLGLTANRLLRNLGWAFIAYMAFWPVCALVAESSTWIYQQFLTAPPNEHKVLLLLETPDLALGWQAVAWTLAGLIAPFFEEFFFRGLLLTWLRKVTQSTWLAIVLSGVAFGMIHMPQYHLVPALSLLGIVAGYLYVRTGSLTLVILFHAIFNTRTLVIMVVG